MKQSEHKELPAIGDVVLLQEFMDTMSGPQAFGVSRWLVTEVEPAKRLMELCRIGAGGKLAEREYVHAASANWKVEE